MDDIIKGYGLTYDEKQPWFKPRFTVLALVCPHHEGEHVGQKEGVVSRHWTFRKGKKVLDALHGALILGAMSEMYFGAAVADPGTIPPFDGNVT